MLHADMVSVLITAGADPGATGAFPQFFDGNSVFVPGVAVALASVSSRDATEMLIHFGARFVGGGNIHRVFLRRVFLLGRR